MSVCYGMWCVLQSSEQMVFVEVCYYTLLSTSLTVHHRDENFRSEFHKHQSQGTQISFIIL